MTITTTHARCARSGRRARTRSTIGRASDHGAIQLVLIAGLACVGGALASAIEVALLLVALTGSWLSASQVVSLGVPFLAVTAPITAIWLLGAIQTGRSIRRVARLNDGADRAAFTALHALLARE
jgi:hypothetical protein